jgi:hypothetical protein
MNALNASLIKVKAKPSLAASKISIGILIVDQAPVNIKT